MERTNSKQLLPDAVYAGTQGEFTQIPNEIIRNPKLSCKAKGVLNILLSNREGWRSYVKTIEGMMKETIITINTALKELELFGYLLRIRYRNKTTKVWRGSFWAYTDKPFVFDIQEHFATLDKQELEPHYKNPVVGNPNMVNPDMGFHRLIILNSKKIKENNSNKLYSAKIIKSQFDNFWKIYPKKTDKGKSKTKWNQLCGKPKNEKPDWKEIKLAIINQKKSDRWQDMKFIPNPTTWLNQSRWLDDPKEMVIYDFDTSEPTGNRTGYTGTDFGPPDEVIE